MNLETLKRVVLGAFTTTVVVVAGCQGNGLNLVKISGKVTYKGAPVTHGTVAFMPDESKGTSGPMAMAVIASDGTYILTTDTTGDGAIVGSHMIGITGLDEKELSGGSTSDPEKDPEGYLKSKAKDAAVARGEIKAKEEEDVYTDKGGRRYRYVVPKKFANPKESGIIVKVDSAKTVNFDIDESGQVRVGP